jgi:hypothetical protein
LPTVSCRIAMIEPVTFVGSCVNLAPADLPGISDSLQAAEVSAQTEGGQDFPSIPPAALFGCFQSCHYAIITTRSRSSRQTCF